MIYDEGCSIKDSAKALDINYCTAKYIVKMFRRKGDLETELIKKEAMNQELQEYFRSKKKYVPPVPTFPETTPTSCA